MDYLSAMWELAVNADKQGIFFFASLYAFFLLSYSFIYQLRIISWPRTKGVLIKAVVEKVGGTKLVVSHQDYAASALYEYYVGDKAYQGSRVSPWAVMASHNARFVLKKQISCIQKNGDGSVEVLFNPKNPKKSFLIKPGKIGLAVTLFFAVGPISLYWSTYHA